MTQYIVLMDISPDQGPLIRPAAEGAEPTIIDEAVLFASPSEFLTVAERALLLINRGVIIPVDQPELIEDAIPRLKKTQADAAQSLKIIT